MTSSKPLQSSLNVRSSRGFTACAEKGRRRFAPRVLVLAISGALAMPGLALASDWSGAASNDWFTGGNWGNPAGVPTNASNVFIDTSVLNLTLINGGNADAQTITIGNAAGGNGTLAIVNAGTLNNVVGTIGNGPSAAGTVTVTGTGSTWTNSSDLSIGENGSGLLTISNGGIVNNAFGLVANQAGSSGTVLVDGGTWANTADLLVGVGGSGSLTIQNGGTVSSVDGSVAVQPNTLGIVTVTGAGSTWTNSGQLLIGNGGNGTLEIAAGAVVSNVDGHVGVGGIATGTVTVDGTNSTWTNTGNLFVGQGGAGSVGVTNGGAVTNVDASVGVDAGSTGMVSVSGANSSWTSTGDLHVGDGGTGTLSILNGGTVIVGNDGSIGTLSGASGVVTVSGAASTLIYSGNLLVGQGGTGTLAISAGGKASNGFGIVGMQAGATGTVTVDGAGSSWASSGSLIVGFLGNGSLAITNGGAVTSNIGNIASAVGTTGTATVTGLGSSWTTLSSMVVGEMGTGSLAISQGGAVNSVGGVVGTAGTGTVAVDGAGSTWTNGGDLFIGLGGTGTLAITNGGAVNVGNDGFVGENAGSSGTVAVNGAASSLAYTRNLVVGNGGNGTLAISGGGKVSNVAATIGESAASTGAVTIDGQGSTWTGDYITVGKDGTGSLAITNGGLAVANNNSGVGIAESAGSTGHVTVDGAGSALTIGGGLSVGVSGTGTLAITRGGSMSTTVAWVGDFTGATGTATVDGAGSAWNNSGDFYIGRDGTGTLTISNGGLVSVGGQVSISTSPGSTGTLNIGGAAGAAPAAPGTLAAALGIDFGGSNPTINFNHTDTSGNYVFGSVISGPGTINQNAGWTNLTGNSNSFNGLVNVNGGRLAVNGSLVGDSLVVVNSGGILGGSGTVSNIQANAGGIVAPGNSIGTLNVTSNVDFAAGSIYQVEVNPAGQSDKLAVTGIATLEGGTVQVLAGAGNYATTTDYSILSATGGVAGTFAGATSNLVFLDPSLSYDPTHVYLKLTRNSKSFRSIGVTANQRAAGGGIEDLGAGNIIYKAALNLSAAQARNSFDLLSGEVHASARSVQLEDSHFMRDASLERLRALDSERVANDGGADPEDGKPARLLPSLRDLAYWSRAMGSWGHIDGDGNAATVKRDTSGFLMGADTRFGDEGRFGLMGGYSRSAFDVSDRNSSGSSDNYHLGAYAGSRWGDLALRTGISYSWHDVSTSRSVAFPGFSDSLKADYKAATTQAFAELGYRIHTGILSEQVGLESFASLAHVNVSSDGFTERGGAAALGSAGNSSGVTFSTLGLRASNSFTLAGGASVAARGSLAWRHAFGNTAPTASMAFAGGSPFAIAGVPIARSAAVVEAGLDFKLTNAATLGLSYGGQFGSGLKDHSARVNLNVAF